MTVPFDLTCWYLNARRIAELVGMEVVVGNRVATSDHLQRLADLNALRLSIIHWIARSAPQPVEKLFLEGKLREGTIATLNTNFFFRGLSKFDESQPSSSQTLPSAYAKLFDLREGLKLTFDFHPEHLTSNSSWSELAGQVRMFVLAVVTEIAADEIRVSPYVIANVVENRSAFLSVGRWTNHLEVHIEQIDSFDRVGDQRRAKSKKALEALRAIPEHAVKQAFADVLGEATVPKDWGGETSDLFSGSLIVDGKRTTAAFAFKGPAKFHPMTLADLGKNGDQINRLFEEPANLLVLQHCHEITTPVRKMMRAFAQQMGNPRTYCVIDGYDTLRLLTAYGKCGFGTADQQADLS